MNITQFTNSFDACVGHAHKQWSENYRGVNVTFRTDGGSTIYASATRPEANGRPGVNLSFSGDDLSKLEKEIREKLNRL